MTNCVTAFCLFPPTALALRYESTAWSGAKFFSFSLSRSFSKKAAETQSYDGNTSAAILPLKMLFLDQAKLVLTDHASLFLVCQGYPS